MDDYPLRLVVIFRAVSYLDWVRYGMHKNKIKITHQLMILQETLAKARRNIRCVLSVNKVSLSVAFLLD